MATALVTGGSSGIGYAFARKLAERGDELVLVARHEDRLRAAAETLHTTYGVTVDTVVADLSSRDDLLAVERIFAERPIDVLVNNAGFAAHAKLLDEDWSNQAKALDVMCLAVLVLSGAAARTMTSRGVGRIINISSVNALIGTDNYSAVKRWMITYTQALDLELAGTGVHATVALPGWVKTNFHQAAGLDRPHIPGWLWVSPEEVAESVLADADRGQVLCVPTTRWKVAAWVLRHGPDALVKCVSNAVASGHRERSQR
ncbi:SDR family NAD(P)-dependent oxidoreductase [Propionibacterium sp.]|uniref:SDR family NAD(P)-dependent oxidoreductase n=1 Tax=Propionibacterium sp. TaxID=1977903 RepID=UPI0039EB688C